MSTYAYYGAAPDIGAVESGAPVTGGTIAGTIGKTSAGGAWRPIDSGAKFANRITVPLGKSYRIDDLKSLIRGSASISGAEDLKPVCWSNIGGLPGNVIWIGTAKTVTGSAGGTIPTVNTPGAGNTSSTTTLSLAYPAVVTAGVKLVIHVEVRSGGTLTTPAGWTLERNALSGTGSFRTYVFSKVAVGSESGSLAITVSGAVFSSGRMYSFSGVGAIEAVDGQGNNNVTMVQKPLTTLGVNRLAVALTSVAVGQALDPFTGTTGGTWTESAAEYNPGSGNALGIQTAPMSSVGTISGGTDTITSSDWDVTTLALTPSGGTPDAAATLVFATGLPTLQGGVNGTDYWIGFIAQGVNDAAEIAYDVGAAGSEQHKTDAGYGSITVGDAFGTPTGNRTDVATLYVDYTDVTQGVVASTEVWGVIPI